MTTATAPAVQPTQGAEITAANLVNAYIARSPTDPKKCAVYVHGRGRHPVIADGFALRIQAQVWIDERQAELRRHG